jgi:hypothetical protein
LQKELKNNPTEIKKAISSIAQISFDNGVIFAHSSITTEQIKKDKAFLRKTKIKDINKNFNEIMDRITIFLKPIVNSIQGKTNDGKTWDINDGIWK